MNYLEDVYLYILRYKFQFSCNLWNNFRSYMIKSTRDKVVDTECFHFIVLTLKLSVQNITPSCYIYDVYVNNVMWLNICLYMLMMSCIYDYIGSDFIFKIILLFRGIRYTPQLTYNITHSTILYTPINTHYFVLPTHIP